MVSPPMVKSVKKKPSKSVITSIKEEEMQAPISIMDMKKSNDTTQSAVGLKIKREALKIK